MSRKVRRVIRFREPGGVSDDAYEKGYLEGLAQGQKQAREYVDRLELILQRLRVDNAQDVAVAKGRRGLETCIRCVSLIPKRNELDQPSTYCMVKQQFRPGTRMKCRNYEHWEQGENEEVVQEATPGSDEEVDEEEWDIEEGDEDEDMRHCGECTYFRMRRSPQGRLRGWCSDRSSWRRSGQSVCGNYDRSEDDDEDVEISCGDCCNWTARGRGRRGRGRNSDVGHCSRLDSNFSRGSGAAVSCSFFDVPDDEEPEL